MNKTFVLAICALHVLAVSGTVNICYRFKKNVLGLTQDPNNDNLKMNDTIYLGHQRLNFTHPALSLDIIFDKLRMSHLTNIKPSIYHYHNQILNLTFPHIFAEGEYDMKGNIGDLFDIFGKGHFRGRFIDFSIAATLDNFYSNGSSICVPATVDVRLGQFKVKFENFMSDEDLGKLMNNAFSSIVPEIIRVFWEETREARDPEIEEWINNLVNGIPVVADLVKELFEKRLDTFESSMLD